MDGNHKNAPGKHYRAGIGMIELVEMFKDEDTARRWLEAVIWKDGKAVCHHCQGTNTYEVTGGRPMSHRCRDCRKHFSVRQGTVFENSHIPLRKWVMGIYLLATNLKGISSMKLHRELDITQKSAWHMLHRIREAFAQQPGGLFCGSVEVDETFMGGVEKNKHESEKRGQGRGATGKTAVIGVKERQSKQVKAQVIEGRDRDTLHHFIETNVDTGTLVYTDDFKAYRQLKNHDHQFVRHGLGEYVNDSVHTNGMESFCGACSSGRTRGPITK